MADKKQGVQAIKEWKEAASVEDWDGTTHTVQLDGDKPIVGLGINLSADAVVTLSYVIGAVNHSVFGSDGAALSMTLTAAVPSYRFLPELAGVRELLITADASQTNATVTIVQA